MLPGNIAGDGMFPCRALAVFESLLTGDLALGQKAAVHRFKNVGFFLFFLFSYEKSELPRAALSMWLQPRSLRVVGKGGPAAP